MCIYEYDAEKHMRTVHNNAYQTGHEAGLEQGETLFATLAQLLIADGRLKDLELAATDKTARMQFYKEYDLISQ